MPSADTFRRHALRVGRRTRTARDRPAYSFYFFRPGHAVLQAAVAGAAYGIGLAVGPTTDAATPWIVVVAGSVVAAALMGELARVDRRVADEQRRAAEDARRLVQVRELLLTAVSHELRTPLNVIAGSAELLDALHQLGHGAMSPATVPVALRELVTEAVAEAGIGTHPVTVEAPDRTVTLDPGFARRILDNLLRNAARHTQPGTPIHLGAAVVDDHTVFEVVDEGGGIPDELKTAVFEPFVRIHHERTGSGVGLALVSALARAHGGTASVHDTDGGGVTVRVELRVDTPVAIATDLADPAPPVGSAVVAHFRDGDDDGPRVAVPHTGRR